MCRVPSRGSDRWSAPMECRADRSCVLRSTAHRCRAHTYPNRETSPCNQAVVSCKRQAQRCDGIDVVCVHIPSKDSSSWQADPQGCKDGEERVEPDVIQVSRGGEVDLA